MGRDGETARTRRLAVELPLVRCGSKTDLMAPKSSFRFVLESGLNVRHRDLSEKCLEATLANQSITSSAMASTPDGIARPSVFATLRLMTNSNLVS
jgi:hypothetical protein